MEKGMDELNEIIICFDVIFGRKGRYFGGLFHEGGGF